MLGESQMRCGSAAIRDERDSGVRGMRRQVNHRMAFKLELTFAPGPVWTAVRCHRRGGWDEADADREVEARFGALRDCLFER